VFAITFYLFYMPYFFRRIITFTRVTVFFLNSETMERSYSFWNGLPFSLVDVYRNFRGAFWLHRQVAGSCGTSMNIYQTTRRLRSQKQTRFLFIYVINGRRRSWRVCQCHPLVYVNWRTTLTDSPISPPLWLLALLVTVDACIVS
jgi:hypothetical protein